MVLLMKYNIHLPFFCLIILFFFIEIPLANSSVTYDFSECSMTLANIHQVKQIVEVVNEFFADLIAVLAHEDPAIISKVLAFSSLPYIYRDFSKNIDSTGWNMTDFHMLLEVIKNEMTSREKDPTLHDLSPTEINDRFIKKLDIALTKFQP